MSKGLKDLLLDIGGEELLESSEQITKSLRFKRQIGENKLDVAYKKLLILLGIPWAFLILAAGFYIFTDRDVELIFRFSFFLLAFELISLMVSSIIWSFKGFLLKLILRPALKEVDESLVFTLEDLNGSKKYYKSRSLRKLMSISEERLKLTCGIEGYEPAQSFEADLAGGQKVLFLAVRDFKGRFIGYYLDY